MEWNCSKQAFPEFNQLLIPYGMQFSFLTVVPKYFNFTVFLKGNVLFLCNRTYAGIKQFLSPITKCSLYITLLDYAKSLQL